MKCQPYISSCLELYRDILETVVATEVCHLEDGVLGLSTCERLVIHITGVGGHWRHWPSFSLLSVAAELLHLSTYQT